MDTTLRKALQNSLSYNEYRELVAEHTLNTTSTGNTQTEALSNYTMLNDRRMKRLDKTIRLSDSIIDIIKKYQRRVTWLVLTESWCGDAAHTMPVINKMALENDNITFRVTLRDTNDALMNQYLTNGGKSIPKLLFIDDDTGEVFNTWGPRPSIATAMVESFKNEHGSLTPEFREKLQLWYNQDKGESTASDIASLMVLERIGN